MRDIKENQVLKDKSGQLWVVMKCNDLCNCLLRPVNIEGDWMACLDENCKDNELDEFEFMN